MSTIFYINGKSIFSVNVGGGKDNGDAQPPGFIASCDHEGRASGSDTTSIKDGGKVIDRRSTSMYVYCI